MGFLGEITNENEGNSRKVLRELRQEVGEKTIQRPTGGSEHVQTQEILQPDLRRGAEGIDQARLQLEGAQAPKAEVRSMRLQQEITSTPHRPGQDEQPAGEHSDSMQVLPRFLAPYGKEAWQDGSWENGVTRVATGVAHRVDRLKAIGNGQVPAVVAAAWHLLIDGVP